MSADGRSLTPPDADRAELERRYRRLLRLYPHEFRARRGTELLGVLMAAAREGQRRPTAAGAADIVVGSLLMRLRGPRGGWASALAAFALLAPLFLVLTDILLVALPYPAGHGHDGGTGLLSARGFLVFAGGHVIVAAAVLAGWRRTALAALIVAGVADFGNWAHLTAFHVLPGSLTALLLTGAVFLLEAFALAVADPREARGQVTARSAASLLLLAGAVQAWSFAADSSASTPRSLLNTPMVTGLVLAAIGVALPLVLGLGWRLSVLWAAAVYPGALGVAFIYTSSSVVPVKTALYLPPLLVACWAAASAARRPAQPAQDAQDARPAQSAPPSRGQ